VAENTGDDSNSRAASAASIMKGFALHKVDATKQEDSPLSS